MIITRTPFRVSFFGGGTDVPAYFQKATGAVLSTTIDRYMYLSAHPYFDGQSIHLKYSRSELAKDVGSVKHPIVRRALERLGHPGGVEITSTADVPAGTGLGSSSAFTVGLLNLLHVDRGRAVDPATLAAEACAIEIDDLASAVGKQDQYASAFGGLNYIRFFPDGSVDVAAVAIGGDARDALLASLSMFYTGEARSAPEVLAEQTREIAADPRKQSALASLAQMAAEGRDLLQANDIARFGSLLHEAWMAKRSLSRRVTTERADAMYDAARAAGAWGGKLLGAGGGGFLLVAAPPAAKERVREALPGARELPVRFDRGGTKIVYMSERS